MGSGYKLISNKESLPLNLEKGLGDYFDKNKYSVTCGIPFKDRLDILSNTLMSLVYQTVKPGEIILVDDSDEPKDLRQMQQYGNIFQLLDYHKIAWRVIWGRKMGQHHSHQIVQEEAKYNLIFRIDSDEIAEPNVIETLVKHMDDPKVGAVGGLVPQNCPPPPLPSNAANIITDLNVPNLQWFQHPDSTVKGVDHLTSSFLYRKGIVKFDLNLSKAAFREETLFCYELKRKGYKLLIDPNVITWHFRAPSRHQNIVDWENDDKLFYSKLSEWGILGEKIKYIILNVGKGDHCVFKKLIPELKKKYDKIILGTCFKDVFEDDNVEQISIAEAGQRLGDLERFNIYKFMIDTNHKDSLENAFRKFYEI
jgi:hypothetical protein